MFLRTCVYRNDNSREKDTFDGLGINNKVPAEEPCPRFAHQLVYDHIKKVMHILKHLLMYTKKKKPYLS